MHLPHVLLGSLALFSTASQGLPQGVTWDISPPGQAPPGCKPDYDGTFSISVAGVDEGVDPIFKRDASDAQPLKLALRSGHLFDQNGRTGYIASNHQYQHDAPPQSGAIYTSGWSICGNNSLALGSDTVFYQCLSGTFYNLYDESIGGQCSPVNIVARPSAISGKQSSTTTYSPQQGEAVASNVAAILGTVAPSEVTHTTLKCEYTRDTSVAAAHWDGVLARGCPMIHLEGPSMDQILRQIHCINPNYPNRAPDGSCDNYCDHLVKRDIDVRDAAAKAVHWDGVTAS
ncbi:hypothetical protein LTS18_007562, partial [Coniosporium uncinatum]